MKRTPAATRRGAVGKQSRAAGGESTTTTNARGSQRKARNAAQTTVPERRPSLANEVRAWIRTADADQLVELMALSNAALPDEDSRKIRPDEVRMLRRLAGQARSLNTSLTDHAAERRSLGERRGRISPEAGDTARWAERLVGALEATLSSCRDTAASPTSAGANEYLDDQSRDFRDNDGTMWRVRIEQRGTSDLVHDVPHMLVLVFRALDGGHTAELVSTGDTGRWELDSYSEIRLRELLAEAQAHVNGPNAE